MSRASLSVIALATVIAFGVWFIGNFERIETEIDGPWEKAAYQNQFLAASLLVESVGLDAGSRSTNSLKSSLPVSDGVVVLPLSLTVALSSELQRSLVSWVEAGGHLVLLLPQTLHERGEQWLETLNFELIEFDTSLDDEDEQSGDESEAEGIAADEDESTYYIQLYSFVHRLGFTFEPEQVTTLGDDYGDIVVQLPRGNGRLTAVAATFPFSNSSLAYEDHARLLLDIVTTGGTSGAVWFFYDVTAEPLYALLWKWVPWMIVTAAVWLLLWLWSRMPRFGPSRAFANEAPRSIVEHVSAAGRLGWRQQAQRGLAEAAVAAVIGKAARRAPEIRRQERSVQIDTLVRLTDIPDEDVAMALAVSTAPSARDFVHQLQRIKAIRNAL